MEKKKQDGRIEELEKLLENSENAKLNKEIGELRKRLESLQSNLNKSEEAAAIERLEGSKKLKKMKIKVRQQEDELQQTYRKLANLERKLFKREACGMKKTHADARKGPTNKQNY